MELRHLRYFVAVAEELHFTRAAERLHIGQPPLSQQIQALEEELGVLLFARHKRKVELTDAGQHFLPRARQILLDTQQAREEVSRIARGETGELRLGFTSSLPLTHILPSALQHYRSKHPHVRLTLREMFTVDQFEAMQRKEIDVGFVRFYGLSPGVGIQVRELHRDTLRVVINAQHPLANEKTLSIAQLKGEEFISYPNTAGTGLHHIIRQLCQACGFEPNIQQEADEALTQISLVSANLGMAILPSPLECVKVEGVRYIPLIDEGAYVSLGIASRKNETSALVLNFLQDLPDWQH